MPRPSTSSKRPASCRTKTALNHEGRSSYSVTVSVHDGKDANGDVDTATDDTIDVTIDVGNVDEAGTVSFAQIGDAVTATVSDPDGSVTQTRSGSGPGLRGEAEAGRTS